MTHNTTAGYREPADRNAALLETVNVKFAYDRRPILSDATFRIRAGEFVGLVGPNGAGKSTLLKVALGILRAETGEIRMSGDPLTALTRNQIARRAAFVPQDTGIGSGFTAYEVVAMGRFPYLGRFQPEGSDDLAAIEHAFAATETTGFRDRLVNELSGGERQRVIIARALAQSTPLMVLDEPTANLDLSHQIEVLSLVRDLCRDHGHAAVAAIHDLGSAARYCDRIAIVHDGRIVADGTPEQVVTELNLRIHFNVSARVRRDEETGDIFVLPREHVRNGEKSRRVTGAEGD